MLRAFFLLVTLTTHARRPSVARREHPGVGRTGIKSHRVSGRHWYACTTVLNGVSACARWKARACSQCGTLWAQLICCGLALEL